MWVKKSSERARVVGWFTKNLAEMMVWQTIFLAFRGKTRVTQLVPRNEIHLKGTAKKLEEKRDWY